MLGVCVWGGGRDWAYDLLTYTTSEWPRMIGMGMWNYPLKFRASGKVEIINL